MDLEEVWRIREEDVYPRIFSNESKGIFVIDDEMLAGIGVEQYDPTWLNHGVFQFFAEFTAQQLGVCHFGCLKSLTHPAV